MKGLSIRPTTTPFYTTVSKNCIWTISVCQRHNCNTIKTVKNVYHQLISVFSCPLIFPFPCFGNLFILFIILAMKILPALTVLYVKFSFPNKLCNSVSVADHLFNQSDKILLTSLRYSSAICNVTDRVLKRISRKMIITEGGGQALL